MVPQKDKKGRKWEKVVFIYCIRIRNPKYAAFKTSEI